MHGIDRVDIAPTDMCLVYYYHYYYPNGTHHATDIEPIFKILIGYRLPTEKAPINWGA